MSIKERRSLELQWMDVCDMVSSEFEILLGAQIQCKANVVESEFWDIKFLNYRMPLPKLCQLLQSLNATAEEWECALPDEGGTHVESITMAVAENLLAHHLRINWEHSIITHESLWLVGVSENYPLTPTQNADGCKLSDELVRAIMTIANHLYQQEERI